MKSSQSSRGEPPYLLHVEIIHDVFEDLTTEMAKEAKSNATTEDLEVYCREQTSFWSQIRSKVDQFSPQHLYQDGLVMVEGLPDVADTSSDNFTYLLELIDRGVTPHATENYFLAMCSLFEILVEDGDDHMKKREKYIVERVCETLPAGERGVLFLGAYHSIETHFEALQEQLTYERWRPSNLENYVAISEKILP